MDRYKLLLWCQKKTNNKDLEDEEDFSMVLDQLIEIMERVGVVSESLSDMSQSFNGETRKDMLDLLSPYRKAKFL